MILNHNSDINMWITNLASPPINFCEKGSGFILLESVCMSGM